MRQSFRYGILAAALALLPLLLHARPEKDEDDKLVRLMSAQSVRILEIDGKSYRRADGPARFLHNNTWLICDTALWNVDEQVIHAMGHVSIEQDRTELTSDKLVYYVDRNLAEFRGTLVQLRDKDNNTLRTTNLDYNTKDSVAVFRSGGAMRDKDGQIIESDDGRYESKIKTFTFDNNVNMFSDSMFVKTSHIIYQSDESLATYPNYVEAWKEDNMFSGNRGWYDKDKELFFFRDNVHLLTGTREAWCDTMYYNRIPSDVEMLGSVQLTDSLRDVTSMSGRLLYIDSLSRVTMTRNPVVCMVNESGEGENRRRDTAYFRADFMEYNTVRRCDVDSSLVGQAEGRLKEISVDAVGNIRAKAAEAAAKAAAEAAENDPNRPPSARKGKQKAPSDGDPSADSPSGPGTDTESSPDIAAGPAASGADSLATADSLAVGDSLARADSLGGADSLALAPPPMDTTRIGFLTALGTVKMFRRDIQCVCDSLLYCDLDSLARLFKDPIVWNDRRHQYEADSIYIVISDGRAQKANLLSDAFVHIAEEGMLFDQIKAAEMTAFFDGEGQLKRFDAMGSASALFYIKEKDTFATANKKEATILTANFLDGEISDVTYFENPKSDAFPIAQMKTEDKKIKGFNWSPDLRPKSPLDLTDRIPRASQRQYYQSRPRARFVHTQKYFNGYMDGIYRQIERSDSLRREREQRRRELERLKKMEEAAAADSLAASDSLSAAASADSTMVRGADSLAVALSTAADSLGNSVADSLAQAASDSLKTVQDSIAATLTPRQLKALQRQEERKAKAAAREAERLARQKAREEHWAELDARDALKQAAKDARKAERKRKKQQKQIDAYIKQQAKEAALKAKYLERYKKEFQKKLDAES